MSMQYVFESERIVSRVGGGVMHEFCFLRYMAAHPETNVAGIRHRGNELWPESWPIFICP